MKTIYDILNKKYDRNLMDIKSYKKKWKKLCEHLESCGISVKATQDIDCFHYELIESSIQVKERFEEVFFDMYVAMHDYWYDLNYQERKKQMNIDIDKLKEELICFMFEGQEVYMPCFPIKFNHLYTDEIVLLDLKQYHKFIRSYANQICRDTYGVLPYANGFSSTYVFGSKDASFVLFHETSARLYYYKDSTYAYALSLDVKRITQDKEVLYTLAEQMMDEDEDALLETLLMSDLLSSRMHKKLDSYKCKKAKKIAKLKKKELKKER